MDTTNQSTLRGQFVTAVLGVTPTYTPHQSDGWRYCKDPHEVGGPNLRNFTILAEPATAEDADISVYGGGISYSYELQVMASYSHLPLVEDEAMIEEDARDLWLALDGVKSSNSGLIDVSFPEWTTDTAAEDGSVVGNFSFLIRYFGRNS